MSPGLPRIAASAIARRDFEAFLRAHHDVPLKVIAAPCGSGKTTAAVSYARGAGHPVDYVRVRKDGSVRDFWDSAGRTFGSSVASIPELIAGAAVHCRELIIDDVESASAEVRTLLAQLPYELSDELSVIYLTRSRLAVDVVRAVTGSAAVIAPVSLLGFAPDEIQRLCARVGLTVSPREVEQLAAATDGWGFAIAGSVREAASHGIGLGAAYRAWHERHELLLREVAERSLLDIPAEYRRAAERLYAGETVPQDVAKVLAGTALATMHGERLRPIRPILEARRSTDAPVPAVPKACIEVFGDFGMIIGDRRVVWRRRRDRQIIAFIALRPDGRATRAELIATFWPHAHPQLAAQSLRTACSTIRRALASCVGYDRVERYFTTGRDVRLDFENVETTAQRLDARLELANAALARDAVDEARAHFESAFRVYRGALLETEGCPPWSSLLADTYQHAIDAGELYRDEMRHNPLYRSRRDTVPGLSTVVA